MSTYRWDLLECWFQLFSTSQIQFRTFFKKNLIFWFPRCSTRWRINYLCRTDIDESRAIFFLGVRKLGVQTEFNFVDFQLFEKNSHFWVSMVSREDLSIDVSITNVGLILTKLRWFIFSGYGQTDRNLESSHGNMSAHKKFQLKAQN